MPYNFEATFVQPLLTQLDNGVIKGADDWANAITNAYVTTIKAGLPQGVPPTLPAPGLNPSAPPPYPIGASPFNTADSRKQIMYNIVHAYFLAKEISLEKGAIEGLVVTVKQMILKIKNRYAQVRSLIEQIKLISEELKLLPQTIKNILEDIKEEIRDQVENIKGIFATLDSFKLELGEIDFKRVFAEEIQLFETMKSFNITNTAGIRDIALFVSAHGQRTNNLLATASREELAKKYVRDRLFAIAKEFLQFAEAAIDPSKILDFLNSLSTQRLRIKRIIDRVKQFDLYVRFLQPKLKLLEKKKNEKIKEIREKIQPKLLDIQKKLQEKIKEFAKKKKDSKSESIYKKAKKNINDLKKRNEKKIKKVQKTIRLGKKAVQNATQLIGKVTSIIEGVKLEFNVIKNEIVEYKKSITQLDDNVSQLEIQKLTNYFTQSGLSEFANLGTLILVQAKCDFQTFKTFFEKKRNTVKQYVDEIKSLEQDYQNLIQIVNELRGNINPTRKNTIGVWINNRIKSVNDLLKLLVKWIKPRVAKIQKWVKKKVEELKTYVKTKLTKFSEDLKVFAINLLPLKSDVQDPKDKAAVAQDKLNKAKDKIKKLKKLVRLSTFIAKMAKGGIGLFNNVTKGNYKFSDNSIYIDNFLDGWFLYRSEDKPQAIQAQLQEEKKRYKNDFKALVLIETLGYALVETFKDISQTAFVKDLREYVNSLKDNIPGKKTYQSLLSVCQQPPKNIEDMRTTLEILGGDVLADIHVVTKITDLERRYLQRSREVIKTICDVKQLEGTKMEKLLLKVVTTIDKNQSFLAVAFKWLGEELKKFKLFISKKIKKASKDIKARLAKKRAAIEAQANKELDKIKEKLVNVEAPIMSFTFGLAARLFWTGATWTGPTGTQHTTFNVGIFKPIKAKSTDGASAMIREMARGFEAQLQLMSGILIPPANTGIPPIPFTGYK